MAGVGFIYATPEITISTSLITVLQIRALAAKRLLVTEWSVSFQGTSHSAAPVLVELRRQTTDGSFTNVAAIKANTGDDEALASIVTAHHTSSSEPTAGDLIDSVLVHPQTGYTWQAPFGREIVVIGAGRLGIVMTAGAGVDIVATIKGWG